MRKNDIARLACAVLTTATVVAATATTAGAAPQITAPSTNPYVVQSAGAGKLAPFTVTATGFRPGQQVFIEQCDGLAITDPHWTPSIDCDAGTSPAPVFTPPSGTVVFDKDSANHRFTPVLGLTPQSQFVCFEASKTPGVPGFNTCKVRISSNNAQPTTDQVFLDMAPVGYHAPKPASSSSSSSTTIVLVVVGALVVVILGAGVALRTRRRPASVRAR